MSSYENKIWKVNAKDKVMDFRSQLVYANISDFANIHGIGGKNHARNSTVECVICDYSAGRGDRSVNVSFNIEAEDIELLYQAAVSASLGTLICNQNLVSTVGACVGTMRSWLNRSEIFPDRTLPVPEADVVQTMQNLNSALYSACWEYAQEKVNPYREENGFSPVSKITIRYKPTRDNGSVSMYPWYVSIENFAAPITRRDNGATTYNGRAAQNRRNAFVNISTQDFLRAMIACRRFIQHWESLYRPALQEGLCNFYNNAENR